jgi:hypothetical protein
MGVRVPPGPHLNTETVPDRKERPGC